MARKFFDLRGLRLKVAMVVLVVMPSFLLFGYNNGSTGGIADLQSFVKVYHPFLKFGLRGLFFNFANRK